jgi:hypothetical protein
MGAIKFLLVISVTFPADFSNVTEFISQGDLEYLLLDVAVKCFTFSFSFFIVVLGMGIL